jgi:hypothetical protein
VTPNAPEAPAPAPAVEAGVSGSNRSPKYGIDDSSSKVFTEMLPTWQ